MLASTCLPLTDHVGSVEVSASQMAPLFKTGKPACLPGGRQPPHPQEPILGTYMHKSFRNEGVWDQISEQL